MGADTVDNENEEYHVEADTMVKKTTNVLGSVSQTDLMELIVKKAQNTREYKKYNELAGILVLSYYKKFGNMQEAINVVYNIINDANGVSEVYKHYMAIKQEESNNNVNDPSEQAKKKVVNTLFNDYRKRFGDKKAESYNVLVLQGWVSKVENMNELVVLMDNVLSVREKLGNSADYELHIIPLLLEKAFTTESLMDYSNSLVNLVFGLNRRLKNSYLAVMTAVKVLEFADSSKVIKAYIRDMIKENNKAMDELNTELVTISANPLSKVRNVVRIREIMQKLNSLSEQNAELMNGIDPKELMLESTKR